MNQGKTQDPTMEKDDTPVVRNPNEIRDLLYTTLTLTEYTKVPILYLGNPGIAKTTGVRTWAKTFGYKVTTLIGTQRVAEEILGYMVNDTGQKRLITYTPDWFDEITENKAAGFKTLLFVDELSQAADNVQGAMLQLIFDRRVGGRDNYLPDDCLVVAAANYKGNIPPQCGIQAPTLNRFCIINVRYSDSTALVDEFLQSEEERTANIPVFKRNIITDNIRADARAILKESLKFMFGTFSKKDDKDIFLDVNNTEYADLFDQPGPIYNFITGRTVDYMYKMALGCIHINLIRKTNKDVVHNIFMGLGGAGTGGLHSDKHKEDYKTAFMTAIQKVLRKAVELNKSEMNATELKFSGKSIDKCISEWLRHQESNGTVNDVNLQKIMVMIKKEYPATAIGMKNFVENFDGTKFLADIQKIEALQNYLKTVQLTEIAPYLKEIGTITSAYETYKVAILNSLTGNN